VHDESQLEDMRAAIRGDFERLAERNGGQELMHVSEELQDDDADPPPAIEAPTKPRRSWLSRLVSS